MENILALRLLVQVAKTGSFSAAGRVLGLSPPSVFRYMNQLEDKIGATLFRRSSRKITLTEIGEAVLLRASAIVRDIDELKIGISGSQDKSGGALRIHARIATGNELIVPVLSRFRRMHEDISLQVVITDRKINFVDDNIDASLTTDLLVDPAIVSREVVSCKFVLCASPAYLQQRSTPSSPSDIEHHDCITFRHDDSDACYRFRRGGIVQVIKPRSVVHTNNANAMTVLALEGQGLIMLPHWLLAADIKAGRLVQLLPDYEPCSASGGDFHRTVWALYPQSRAAYPRLQVFLDFLVDALQKRARLSWS